MIAYVLPVCFGQSIESIFEGRGEILYCRDCGEPTEIVHARE
jgi:hypothetical protein